MEKDAIALITEAAAEPTLDELARRARAVAALAQPTDVDLTDWARHWRAQRAAWNSRKEEKADEGE